MFLDAKSRKTSRIDRKILKITAKIIKALEQEGINFQLHSFEVNNNIIKPTQVINTLEEKLKSRGHIEELEYFREHGELDWDYLDKNYSLVTEDKCWD